MRTLQSMTKNAVGFNTISKVLKCERLPTWSSLQPVVLALDGDVEEFRRLWLAVRDCQMPLDTSPRVDSARETYDDRPRLELPRGLGADDAAQQDLQERMYAQEQEEDSLRRQLAAATERAADLADELVRLRARLGHLKQQASTAETLRSVLLANISELERERNQLQEQCEALLEDIRKSRDKYSELQKENVELAVRMGNLNFEWARSEELLKDRTRALLQEERERVRALETQLAEANRRPGQTHTP